MRTVCTHVAQNAFAATMGAMRTWLDHNGDPDVRFDTATDGISIQINLDFSGDDVADAFERRFGNMPPPTDKTAA